MSYFLPMIVVSAIAWWVVTRKGFFDFLGGSGDSSAPPDGSHER